VVLSFPDEGIRFDFFFAEGAEDLVRQVNADGSEELFRAVMPEDLAAVNGIMSAWYDSVAAFYGLVPDVTVDIPAEAEIFDGSAWVHERAGLEIFVEDVDNFKVLITWANSASDAMEWTYGCSYDETDHSLKAAYMILDHVEYSENGDENRTCEKEGESTAVFSLDDQGNLVVTDEAEPQLNGLAFEPATPDAE